MSDRLGARRSPTLIPFEELVLVALLAFVPVVFTRATKECFEVPQSALLATGAPSLPPATCMPAPVRHVWPAPAPVQVVATQVALSFQARAPPVV